MAESMFIKFEPAKIAEVASYIQTKHGELQQNITGIKQKANTLRQSWNSDGRADVFYTTSSELSIKGEELVKELKTFGDRLNQASGLYKTGENDAKQGVEQLPTEGIFRT